MSNYLAIATVTAGVRQLIRDSAEGAVSGASITTSRPDAPGSGTPDPRVNLFLYHVAPNSAWRNADLPSRRADGTLASRPTAALDLYYLLSFYGDESQLEPQRLLGSVVGALHARPILDRNTIQAAIAAGPGDFLQDSDLADQIESVRLTPMAMNLEELSKLWSVFFQTPYALSVAYVCSVILIEAPLTPQSALPVRAANVRAISFRRPVIEQVLSAAGATEPITSQSVMVVRGSALDGDNARIVIGDVEFTPTSITATEARLDLSTISATNLRSGVQGVQIIYPVAMNAATTIDRAIDSNMAAFVLHPDITRIQALNPQGTGNALRSADIEVRIRPRVGKTQRVTLLLNEFNAPSSRSARGYVFEAPSRDLPEEPDSTNIITIPVSQIAEGRYVARIRIDGADSPIEINNAGVYATPRVTIP